MIENPKRDVSSAFADETDGSSEPDFKPLSADGARRWREQHPVLSPWWIVRAQLAVGVLVAVLAGVLAGSWSVAWSAGYGALAVVVPAALLARGMTRQAGAAGAVLAGFFVWELVKIVLTVAMLAAAPRLVPQLSWLALLAGFVVAMKVYWVAVWLHPARRKSV